LLILALDFLAGDVTDFSNSGFGLVLMFFMNNLRLSASVFAFAIAVFIFSTTPLSSAQAAPVSKAESDEYLGTSDPLESFNRKVYAFNREIDIWLLTPVTKFYRYTVPEHGRRGIHNFLKNIASPVYLLNNVLQGNVEGSFTVFWRFVLNTSFGIGGLGDFASLSGLRPAENDFGRTLGVWGVSTGPYLVVPVLGPFNTRDLTGFAVDSLTSPINYAETTVVVTHSALYGLDKREGLMDVIYDIEHSALDPYVAFRSMYLQNRIKAVKRSKEAAYRLPKSK
jgi:phospholipid-binding lipoprotein MlaA